MPKQQLNIIEKKPQTNQSRSAQLKYKGRKLRITTKLEGKN